MTLDMQLKITLNKEINSKILNSKSFENKFLNTIEWYLSKNIKDIKILIFGGMANWQRIKIIAKDFNNLTALYKNKKQNPNFLTGNLDKIVDTIKKINPKIIINSAAFTNVDKCEEKSKIFKQNKWNCPKKISQYCFKKNFTYSFIN